MAAIAIAIFPELPMADLCAMLAIRNAPAPARADDLRANMLPGNGSHERQRQQREDGDG
jgi:hypothetical protein